MKPYYHFFKYNQFDKILCVRRTSVLLKRNGFPIRLRYTSQERLRLSGAKAFGLCLRKTDQNDSLRPLALDPKGHAGRDPPLWWVAWRSEALASRSHSYTQVFYQIIFYKMYSI